MRSCRRWNKRDTIKATIAAAALPLPAWSGATGMIKRMIPSGEELLPVIGLGTYSVFDVNSTAEELAPRERIVDLMVEMGASLIDSSPMYGRSEKVVGDIVSKNARRARLFLATKVWTDGKAAGERQMQASSDLMHADVIDLMQVHNLRDLDVHMGSIREWQQGGRIRYSGMTDYRESALDELEAAMRRYKPQFIQINYSLGESAADERLLPLAQELGIAVLVNRPFMNGALFRAVRGRSLPDWAAPFAASWGQFFLKFIVSHPAVTCVIPATSKPEHMQDNLGAGFGELPSKDTRRKMIEFVKAL
ncbi:MAG TPA: aldo/keto reductase [Woeseiaceae bacterium]|nr:aldo/keto reductase [Woeseiaceae bacterium]